MKEEIWKDVVGYSNYEVSNLGNVRNKTTKKLLSQKIGRDGRYLSVYLSENGNENTKRVHRLVAESFLGVNPGLVVNHIDGNKLNNNVDNLEWCSVRENNIHAIRTGLNHPGEYQKRKIRIIETGEIFDGVTDCAIAINGDFRNVHRSLNSDRKYSVNGLHFEYVNDKDTEKKSFLYDYQIDAIEHLNNGYILNGGVGSGKSLTALGYYYFMNHGSMEFLKGGNYKKMPNPQDLYIITTAMKRDTHEWEKELIPFLLSTKQDENSLYSNKVVVDSWNNIKKYVDVQNAFFIFDEQRVCGSGAWVKSFLKITKNNIWILLSASPGDTWMDYAPVFIANGFYKNRSEFIREHVIYSRFTKYPKIDRYINTGRLIRLRNKILVDMDFHRDTIAHHEDVYVQYDISLYRSVGRTRWNPYTNEPLTNAAELCYLWRKIVNSDESRQMAVLDIVADHPRVIIFYNFDYERDILKSMEYINDGESLEVAEWSGHAHQPIPDSNKWVYLVQYTAGCEGWNSIKTDTIIFYSQNYSYKVMIQAAGRIDRLNTPYKDLYYYHLKSRSGIDLAISKALSQKKKFNEGKFVKW